jgi:transposase-like protein
MPERRSGFGPQFKVEAVQMVLKTGRSVAEVARDLGIHDGTLEIGRSTDSATAAWAGWPRAEPHR